MARCRWYKLVNKKPVPDEGNGTWINRDGEERQVALTVVYEKDNCYVSTCFLGLDHNFDPDDPEPILFETLVFNGEMDGEMDRYKTWEEAEKGHKKIVSKVKKHYKAKRKNESNNRRK